MSVEDSDGVSVLHVQHAVHGLALFGQRNHATKCAQSFKREVAELRPTPAVRAGSTTHRPRNLQEELRRGRSEVDFSVVLRGGNSRPQSLAHSRS